MENTAKAENTFPAEYKDQYPGAEAQLQTLGLSEKARENALVEFATLLKEALAKSEGELPADNYDTLFSAFLQTLPQREGEGELPPKQAECEPQGEDQEADTVLLDLEGPYFRLYKKMWKRLTKTHRQDDKMAAVLSHLIYQLEDLQNSKTPVNTLTPYGFQAFYEELSTDLTPLEEEERTDLLSIWRDMSIAERFSLLFLICTVLLLLLHGVYFLLNKLYGAEYLFDSLFYIVNFLILVFATAFLLCRYKKRWVLVTAITLCALLSLGNFILMADDVSEFEKYYYTAPSGGIQMILKREIKTGQTWVSSNKRALFVRFRRRLPHPINTPTKVQWLTNDICAVTYTDTSGDLVQYVATYGDRGDGSYYYFVENALAGIWTLPDNRGTLQIDRDGVILDVDGKREYYKHSDCVQQGTTALVFKKDGIAKWTVAMPEDCNLNSARRVHLQSNILLCPVSMEDTQPLTLTLSQSNSTAGNGTDGDSGSGVSPVFKEDLTTMTEILQNEPKIKNIKNLPPGISKLETSSTDLFALGQKVYLNRLKTFAKDGVEVEAELYLTKILAGDKEEFLVKVYAVVTMKRSSASQETPGTTNYVHAYYRMKKGEGGYLFIDTDEESGYYGLKQLPEPLELDTEGNKKYLYRFP